MMLCFIQALFPITDGPFQSLLTAVVKGKPGKKSCHHAHYILPYWFSVFIILHKYTSLKWHHGTSKSKVQNLFSRSQAVLSSRYRWIFVWIQLELHT